jgi:2-amino-4-hydroxy-6-hydroxymethyldihydropteridine diphosphokinase
VTDTPAIAYIGVGSNLQPDENVPLALELLGGTPGINLTGISTFYRTAALTDPESLGSAPGVARGDADPDFLNGVLEIRTLLSASELLKRFAQIEEDLGRERPGDRWAPRTMDLDLLLFGIDEGPGSSPEWKPIGGEELMAHGDILKRGFVALPLLELAPDLVIPPHRIPLRALALSFGSPGGKAEDTLTDDLRARFLSA